jgi:hypothetical protein
VDSRAEVREFLISRRAKITPEKAGVSVAGIAVSLDCVAARSQLWLG